jgi:hypothetical protein
MFNTAPTEPNEALWIFVCYMKERVHQTAEQWLMRPRRSDPWAVDRQTGIFPIGREAPSSCKRSVLRPCFGYVSIRRWSIVQSRTLAWGVQEFILTGEMMPLTWWVRQLKRPALAEAMNFVTTGQALEPFPNSTLRLVYSDALEVIKDELMRDNQDRNRTCSMEIGVSRHGTWEGF